MKAVYLLLAVVGILGGLYFAVSSLTAQVMTGEHAATLACAFFLFAIAVGVWRDPRHGDSS